MAHNPQWSGAIEAHAKNQIIKNIWKFELLGYEFEDLLQEAWIIFEFCKNRYVVENEKHFMSLFKKCLHDKLYDLAKLRDTNKERLIGMDNIELMKEHKNIQVLDDNHFSVLLKQAPQEVKEVLNLIFNAPNELLEMIGIRGGGKKLSNKLLCGVLGYNSEKKNLIKMIKDYFNNEYI